MIMVESDYKRITVSVVDAIYCSLSNIVHCMESI